MGGCQWPVAENAPRGWRMMYERVGLVGMRMTRESGRIEFSSVHLNPTPNPPPQSGGLEGGRRTDVIAGFQD